VYDPPVHEARRSPAPRVYVVVSPFSVRLAVLRARHAIARRVVGVGHVAIGGKAAEAVVGVGLVRRLGQLGRLGRIA
jgi:hypothetical protein